MRRFRRLLEFVAVLALILALFFDVMLVLQIYAYGFPPDHTLRFSEDGRLIEGFSTEEQVQFSLVLAGIGLFQAFLFRLTWKAWRR